MARGYQCETASSGAQGLDLVTKRLELVKQGKAEMYALIFLNYSLPEMDGQQMARALRSNFEASSDLDFRQPQINCYTAYTDENFKSKAMSAGINSFLSMPIKDADLALCLKKAFK